MKAYADIDPTAGDAVIAEALATVLLKMGPRPTYKFAIDHDVRAAACATNKPKTGRCQLKYEWTLGSEVGIETRDRGVARDWITHALSLGYRVSRYQSGSKTLLQYESVEQARRYAEFERRPRVPIGEIDDEIPF